MATPSFLASTVAPDQGEIAVFLAPLGKTAAAINGRGRDQYSDVGRIVGLEQAL